MKKLLKKALKEGIISENQEKKLLELYKKEKFDFSKIAIYLAEAFGIGLIILMATMNFGAFNLVISTFIYIFIFYLIIIKTKIDEAKIVATTSIIFLFPLFIYSLFDYFNISLNFDKQMLIVGILEILVSLFLLKKTNYKYLVVFIVLSLVFVAFNLCSIFIVRDFNYFHISAFVFGFYSMFLGYFIKNEDYSYWFNLIGVLLFWIGFTFINKTSELAYFIYLIVNIALFSVGALLLNRTFINFAILGILFYLGHLSMLFKSQIATLLFVNGIGALSVLLILFGIKYKQYEDILIDKLSFFQKIDKRFLLIFALFPVFYLMFFVKYENKYHTKYTKSNHTNIKNYEPVLIIRCNQNKFKIHKIVATNIENGIETNKTIYIYKSKIFNSLNEFKHKYCN